MLRLRRGTYAPHIIEHVALELQTMVGHDVGYGRTRGGDVPGEYTLVFEHAHEQVGLRAAALALEMVQQAFDGGLESVEAAVAELAALAATPDSPPLQGRVLCGVTGGDGRAEAQRLLRHRISRSRRPSSWTCRRRTCCRRGYRTPGRDMAIILDAATDRRARSAIATRSGRAGS